MSAEVEDQPPNKVYPPWTDDVVTALNGYQASGRAHPFTCGAGQLGDHVGGVALVADNDGWHCALQSCDYTQDWA